MLAISAHASRMFLLMCCCPVLKKLPCAVCVREKKAPRALRGCGPPAGISAAARTCGPSSPEWLRGKNRRTPHLGKLISPSDSNPKMFSSGGVCYECEGLRVSFQKVPKPLWRHFAGKVGLPPARSGFREAGFVESGLWQAGLPAKCRRSGLGPCRFTGNLPPKWLSNLRCRLARFFGAEPAREPLTSFVFFLNSVCLPLDSVSIFLSNRRVLLYRKQTPTAALPAPRQAQA